MNFGYPMAETPRCIKVPGKRARSDQTDKGRFSRRKLAKRQQANMLQKRHDKKPVPKDDRLLRCLV